MGREKVEKVLVTGSRKWTDPEPIFRVLDELDPDIVIHGGADGADLISHQWCKKRGRRALVFFPDYSKKDGPLSPPLRRNLDMIDERPDVVAAFPMPDSRGTWFTVKESTKANIEVIITKGEY